MTKKDEWVEKSSLELGGIILKGFALRENDGMMLHRHITNAHDRMIAWLKKVYDEFNPPAPLPVNPQKGKP